jgi:hypothetical protein
MVDFKAGQHAIVEGINGSGKTFAVRNGLLPLWDRVLVVDTEGLEFNDFPAVDVQQTIRLLRSDYSFYARLPLSGDLDTDLSVIDALALGVRRGLTKQAQPSVIYFDEFTDEADASVIPPSLRSLIRTARKRNLSIIAGTQRPQLMNKTMVANAIHRFYFFMSEYDAEQIRSYAPFVKENLSRIPYGSFKSIYQRPDSSIVILSPFPEYDWTSRLKKGKP